VILDLCSSLATLLEPTMTAAARVVLDKEPTVWEADRLYVYPVRVDEVPFETGPTRRQDFTVNAVFITDDKGEGAALEPTEALATVLDTKRGDYMRIVRQNYHNAVWEHLRALSDTPNPLPIDKRSAAVRVSGWRLVN
jgi:hypothetical protein